VVPVQVSWTDAQGIESQRDGYSLDTSSGGLKIELPSPLPINSFITVRSVRLNFVGSGSVRHCRRDGRRYFVGVTFQPSPSEVARSNRHSQTEYKKTSLMIQRSNVSTCLTSQQLTTFGCTFRISKPESQDELVPGALGTRGCCSEWRLPSGLLWVCFSY